jgi:hypothetical protein
MGEIAVLRSGQMTEEQYDGPAGWSAGPLPMICRDIAGARF